MDESKYIWMDGEFVLWENAKVHVLVHALHYGSGVFEGIRMYKTHDNKAAIFRLDDHLDRLFYSAKALEMDIPYSKEELSKAIIELVKKNDIQQGYIRPLAFFGYGKMGLNPKGAEVNTVLAVWPWGSYLGEDKIKVKTSSIVRIHPKTTDTKAKICGNYVNSILASLEAHREDYHEALLLDYEGNISEGPGENVYFVKDKVIYTPESGNILEGITRSCVFEIAKDENIKIIEKKCSVNEFKNADEAFFTGTAAEITPIYQLDESKIGNGKIGPISDKLKRIYTDAIKGKIPKYNNWLTYVV